MQAQRHTLANALRVAAERYEENAASVALPRISEQFKHQAVEARKLADDIEQANQIILRD